MESKEQRARYLGMKPGDLEGKPYARFWNPDMAPLPAHAREALAHGPVAEPLLPPLAQAQGTLEGREQGLENGFCLLTGGAMHLAIYTRMPDVSPEMVDWWFAWHSDEPQRYKLWHPRAHVHAAWRTQPPPGTTGRGRYVGQTSCVDEYIGSTVGSYAIRFVPPQELGLDGRLLADPRQATAICARVGFADWPLDFGYLAHYVSRVEGGAEMRSRFWIGGEYAKARRGGPIANLALAGIKRFMKPTAQDGSALLVHCSQEMSHLASFLPKIHAELSGEG